MTKPTILVADDEPDALELVRFNLEAAGCKVLEAGDGAEALRKARAHAPDLIVLDVMMPELDGFEVCKLLRKDPATAGILILMLTAKAAEIDRVLGLELGADDYVTKPFSPRELVLRIKKLLARAQAAAAPKEQLRLGRLFIDVPQHLVTLANQPLDLTATEFNLLVFLAQRPGLIQSRERLLQDVWGYEKCVDTRTVDTHIRRLREKLGPTGENIETIRNFGYRFKAG